MAVAITLVDVTTTPADVGRPPYPMIYPVPFSVDGPQSGYPLFGSF
jgi:hypothetical protein